jgi:type I restriction enzyme R subunit
VYATCTVVGKTDDGQNQKIADVKQLQEDLEQEKADNQVNPEEKQQALMGIIADYNAQYGSNHTINEFDSYYQDVQSALKTTNTAIEMTPTKTKSTL